MNVVTSILTGLAVGAALGFIWGMLASVARFVGIILNAYREPDTSIAEHDGLGFTSRAEILAGIVIRGDHA
jgi:hypothetical protein